jgi:hypothetical protein
MSDLIGTVRSGWFEVVDVDLEQIARVQAPAAAVVPGSPQCATEDQILR